MGISEETTDTEMRNKHKNERNERILNLTLEIIYLLTGEGYIVTKTSDDGVPQSCSDCMLEGSCRLHTPTVAHSSLSIIQKENDKKILELLSNIIHLLTGEEWGGLKGNKARYSKEIKENPEQLHSLNCDSEEKSNFSHKLETTICSNNEPSKSVAEETGFCADRKLQNTEISPAEQHSPANGIKEEQGSWEEEYQSDCSINPLTEQIKGTDKSTSNNTSANSLINEIKEEPASCDEDDSSEQMQVIDPTLHIVECSIDDSSPEIHFRKTSKKFNKSTGTSPQITPTLPVIYTCAECNKSFARKGDLNRHKKVHTGEKPYSCSECGRCFAYRSALNVHQKTHMRDKAFICSDCGKCFVQFSHLNEHQKIHTEKPFCCFECGKCFTVRSNLEAHLQTHTRKRPFSCSECGKCFTKRSGLKAHKKIHTGEKPYSCSVCGKCFTVRSNLNAHRKIHTGEKTFSCTECGKSFTHCSTLIAHQKIHTGEKSFYCSECGKCFRHRSTLHVHQKVHKGEKPFGCSECGKRFSQRSGLMAHKKIHTGEKPFSCPICGKCFTQRSNLTVHYRVHQ